MTAQHADAQVAPPQYGIKADEPPIGSRIRRDAVGPVSIPVNRTYSELTQNEQSIIRSWYENLAPDDEPPYPKEGTKPVHQMMQKIQAALLVEGKLYLIATVEPNGEVSGVQAIGSPSPELTKLAATALVLTKFKPALCKGQPCRMEFPLWYEFILQ